MAYRGINTYDAKKVIRPTMVPDREEARASGGAYTHMLETDFNGPPPPPPADPLAWGDTAHRYWHDTARQHAHRNTGHSDWWHEPSTQGALALAR